MVIHAQFEHPFKNKRIMKFYGTMYGDEEASVQVQGLCQIGVRIYIFFLYLYV